jgi:hypothetical protein
LRSSWAALEAWKALEHERGLRLFVEAGALWLAHHDDGFEAASLDSPADGPYSLRRPRSANAGLRGGSASPLERVSR